MNVPIGELEMWRLECDLLRPGFIHAFTHILITPPSFLTITDWKPCALVA